MRTIRPYTVVTALPKRLQALKEIAYNLWWTWHQEGRELFIRLEPNLWESTGRNPVALLGRISQARLEEVSRDEGFMAQLERVQESLREYLKSKTWYDTACQGKPKRNIAYFSLEFGLHECVPLYSGGLGVLAGDHLKSASGLGLPVSGISLFYYNGYCRQYLNQDGWQQEFLQRNDFYTLPCTLERDAGGKPVLASVEYPNPAREVQFQIWRVQVGRCPLFLLDSRLQANRPEDRSITDQLYGGDYEHRIQQEIALGIGGFRALRALGMTPEICHMNEGHSAFLAVERIRILIEEEGLSFEQAKEAVTAGNVFTTHTPVPAGIDKYGGEVMDRYFGSWYGRLRCDRRTFLALGRFRPHDEGEPFSMAILALKTAACANGVSKLHGQVSRNLWRDLYPEVPVHEVPISSITNGVHIRSYVSDQLNELFVRYAGMRWSYEAVEPGEGRNWTAAERLPDSELWRVHERSRAILVTWARQRLRKQLERRGAGPQELKAAAEALDPEALTIGFARRFTAYKRGMLVFKDPDRLARLLASRERPVQILMAGKAHPRDQEGKKVIQQIAQLARDPRFRSRVVFIEDYDLVVARHFVQGMDIWLNTPRRPHEASGTSGMKAAANGVLNCSILDGWWCEGYDGFNGWAIGAGEEYSDLEYQDQVESQALYDLLERRIVPEFYERDANGLPRQWIQRMKRALTTCVPVYSSTRMVREYAEQFYLPAGARWHNLNAHHAQGARELWDWKMTLYQRWAQIRIENVEVSGEEAPVGGQLEVRAQVHLGPILPEWVDVQAYAGELDDQGQVAAGQAHSLRRDPHWKNGEGRHLFKGSIPCPASGRFGFAVRVVPHNPNLPSSIIPGLITWD